MVINVCSYDKYANEKGTKFNWSYFILRIDWYIELMELKQQFTKLRYHQNCMDR